MVFILNILRYNQTYKEKNGSSIKKDGKAGKSTKKNTDLA
jgi:hypothetical protein